MKTDKPRIIELKDYQPSEFLIDTVNLDIKLNPSETQVKSKLHIRKNPDATSNSGCLKLDGENLNLEKISINRRKVDKKNYKINKKQLIVLNVPDKPFTLEITTTCDPASNKALSGLYLSGNIYCTQCEAEGFRRITYYLDRPDVLAVFTTRIEADKKEAPILLSNGNLEDSGKLRKKDWHYAIWHDPHPKPSYLFALVGGDLAKVSDSFTTRSKKDIELNIYVEHGKEDRCDWAMESLKRSMRWDEKRFGLEYDLDVFNIVAVSDFNMGAMENKGLNIFNDKLIIASPDTATDSNYAAIEAVIAHEYFHNWTGNRITCRDWFQLCLKEGLTVFRDQEFTSDMRSRNVSRIQNVRQLRKHQFPEDGGPLAHPVRPESYIEINNFYTATVYEKGSEICRMIMTMVGRQGFRKGMNLYFKRHDGEAATVEDFISSMADANDISLDQFMLWYSQAGTPQVMAQLEYNKKRQETKLIFHQICPKTPGQSSKKPYHIPIKLALLDPNGEENELVTTDGEKLEDSLFHFTKRQQSITFSGIPNKPVPSVLREFSAPVHVEMKQTDKELEFLSLHDTDLFNRWEAIQNYASRIIVDLVDAVASGKRSKKGARLAKILGEILTDNDLEEAYRAECLSLPGEADIAREIGKNVNPQYIHEARNMLISSISKDLYEPLLMLYERLSTKGKYSLTAKNVGKRSLRNAVLYLLSPSARKEDIQRVSDQYWEARNMTDKIAALTILSDTISEERDEIFEHFYQEFKEDHLVLDKWFSLQALSSSSDTYERVKSLKKHPKFSLKNPNRVRSLIAVFAQSNAIHFHAEDGSGYKLVGETILEIDRFNPQVAARLSGAFKSWRMLEPKRQKKAKSELQVILEDKKISKDTYEIISKTLGLRV